MSPTTKSKAQRALAVRRVPIGLRREKQAGSQMDKQQRGVSRRRRNENECLPMKKKV